MNKAIVLGNLGADAELRHTANGTPVTSFRVATNRRWTPKDGTEMKEETEWHNIVAWGRLAEVCGQYLKKGQPALVEGRLQTRSWEKEGVTRYMTEIVADNVIFLGAKATGARIEGRNEELDRLSSQNTPEARGMTAPVAYPETDHADDKEPDLPF
jgi:single-strand DNA-binding protein